MKGYNLAVMCVVTLCFGSAVALKCHQCIYSSLFPEFGNCDKPTGQGDECPQGKTVCKTEINWIGDLGGINRTCSESSKCQPVNNRFGDIRNEVTCCSSPACNNRPSGGSTSVRIDTLIFTITMAAVLIASFA